MDDAVTAAVEQTLGSQADEIERLALGLVHETYTVEADGESYILQFSGADEDDDHTLQRGLDCYQLLATADVPVPRVVTSEVQTVDEPDSTPHAYTLVERLPGQSGERAISPERARNAGATLARIHDQHRFGTTGRLTLKDDTPTVEPFPEGSMTERIQQQARRNARTFRAHGHNTIATGIEQLLQQCPTPSAPSSQPVLCHGDYSPDNILFNDDTVAGILDFDNAHAGPAIHDLVHSATGFWMHDPNADWCPRHQFYTGYQNERNPEPAFEHLEPTLRVLTLAHTVASMERGGHLTNYERDFYTDTLQTMIDNPDRPKRGPPD